jgi:arylformamidase
MAHGWSAALPGYMLAPDANLTRITNELRAAFDWLDARAADHGIEGPVIVTGWSAGGHLTALILDHRTVTAGLSICHGAWRLVGRGTQATSPPPGGEVLS